MGNLGQKTRRAAAETGAGLRGHKERSPERKDRQALEGATQPCGGAAKCRCWETPSPKALGGVSRLQHGSPICAQKVPGYLDSFL